MTARAAARYIHPLAIEIPKYRFPWRPDNAFRLLVDGERFFPAMLEAIDEARSHVLLELYLMESGRVADRFIDALVRAATRGLVVCVLVDAFGAYNLSRRDRSRLTGAGARLALYNPIRYGELRRYLFRDHRKLLLVDGERVFTGGYGLTDGFQPKHDPELAWHDVVLEARGPVVADWQTLFESNWRRWDPVPLELPPAAGGPVGPHPGRLVLSQPDRGAEVKRSLVKRVRSAERRIWIATAYFIPSRKVRRALRRAARAGVDVRLLLPGPHTDHPGARHAGRRYYLRLLRAGVRIFEFQPRFLHAKVALCDHWVAIGSSNVDRWNLRLNLEANQEVEDEALAEEVAAWFGEDFAQSQEYRYAEWQARPLLGRLQERWWGQVDRWLERFTRLRR